ncbi:MAG: IS1 family transposase [Magnetococcales bacterium]|nr:IS1 family transposase [Magnetococcales bacterium]
MAVIDVQCPSCHTLDVVKYGRQANGAQRYRCCNPDCDRRVFLLDYHSHRDGHDRRRQIIEMALFGTGAMETAQLLGADAEEVVQLYHRLTQFSWHPSMEPASFQAMLSAR